MRKPFIAGNWKMNMSRVKAISFARKLRNLYGDTDVKTAVCAPFVHLETLKSIFDGTDIKVGAQNCHFEDKGAFTGEISVDMLEEIGVDYCIVGHSERREYFGETDEAVNKKLHRLFASSVLPILCVGEKIEERDAGIEKDVVKEQIEKALDGLDAKDVSRLTVAYEPIWAIGTGRTASPEQANEMCGYIRDVIEELYNDDIACSVTIQYGGSMKPSNATELMNMEEIDGGLIGGASLNVEDFIGVIDF